jgi:glycosyltransferase involved in cell wall biosynthesis
MTAQTSTTRAKARTVAYVQYTNPGAYPPLQHSSNIFANNGWNVVFFGTGGVGAGDFVLPSHANIHVDSIPFRNSGWLQKAHYLRYALRVLFRCMRVRPSVIYASDPLSCPIALFASYVLRIPVIYHEHDSPTGEKSGVTNLVVHWARCRLATRALRNVLPNADRAQKFAERTGAATERICVVWNCPSLKEMTAEVPARIAVGMSLYYHGSINCERVPLEILDALVLLPSSVKFQFAGYETTGSKGYVDEFLSNASKLGVRSRVTYCGTRALRQDVLKLAAESEVGWSCVPMNSEDINMVSMLGASNKAFDYLLAGCPLIVSELPDWREVFVKQGVALSCDPRNPESIAAALRRYLEHPEKHHLMALRGRQLIRERWNYEVEFEKVLTVVANSHTSSS